MAGYQLSAFSYQPPSCHSELKAKNLVLGEDVAYGRRTVSEIHQILRSALKDMIVARLPVCLSARLPMQGEAGG